MTGAAPMPDELSTIKATRLERLEPVTQPLCLISQLPRSGGTLLMRLFDGHPQCHVFPHEFGGEVSKEIDPEWSAEQAWAAIHPPGMESYFKRGYAVVQRKNSPTKAKVAFPLLVVPSLQKQIFLESYPKEFTERAVFSAYYTSYFNAWVDNQSLITGTPKDWVVAFEPRAILGERYRKRLNEVYPEGRVISVIREPQSWYASARIWSEEWPSVRPAIHDWRKGVETLLRTKGELGDRMTIVLFSDLVQRTDAVMRTLSAWLGIKPAREGRAPTFNGRPVVPNTSFRVDTTDVSTAPLKRAKSLSERDRVEIDSLAGDLMDQVAEVASQPREKPAKAKKAKAWT